MTQAKWDSMAAGKWSIDQAEKIALGHVRPALPVEFEQVQRTAISVLEFHGKQERERCRQILLEVGDKFPKAQKEVDDALSYITPLKESDTTQATGDSFAPVPPSAPVRSN